MKCLPIATTLDLTRDRIEAPGFWARGLCCCPGPFGSLKSVVWGPIHVHLTSLHSIWTRVCSLHLAGPLGSGATALHQWLGGNQGVRKHWGLHDVNLMEVWGGRTFGTSTQVFLIPRTSLQPSRPPEILQDWASSRKCCCSGCSASRLILAFPEPPRYCAYLSPSFPAPPSGPSLTHLTPHTLEVTYLTPWAPTVPCLPSWKTHTPPIQTGAQPHHWSFLYGVQKREYFLMEGWRSQLPHLWVLIDEWGQTLKEMPWGCFSRQMLRTDRNNLLGKL